ncbi:sigma-70 factor domain-containing protein [Phormidesmis sp. 146-33]
MDFLKIYLNQIGRIPPLSQDEEIYYGRQVKQLQYVTQVRDSLTQQLGNSVSCSAWCEAVNLSEESLLKTLISGETAKCHMTEANLRLVPIRKLELP